MMHLFSRLYPSFGYLRKFFPPRGLKYSLLRPTKSSSKPCTGIKQSDFGWWGFLVPLIRNCMNVYSSPTVCLAKLDRVDYHVTIQNSKRTPSWHVPNAWPREIIKLATIYICTDTPGGFITGETRAQLIRPSLWGYNHPYKAVYYSTSVVMARQRGRD